MSRGGAVAAVAGLAIVLAGCSDSHHYGDDRDRVRTEIDRFAKNLLQFHRITTSSDVSLGTCRAHAAPIQWSAPLSRGVATSPEYDRANTIAAAANGAIDLGVKYFIVTAARDPAMIFTTSDRDTQLTVTTDDTRARVDGFASC